MKNSLLLALLLMSLAGCRTFEIAVDPPTPAVALSDPPAATPTPGSAPELTTPLPASTPGTPRLVLLSPDNGTANNEIVTVDLTETVHHPTLGQNHLLHAGVALNHAVYYVDFNSAIERSDLAGQVHSVDWARTSVTGLAGWAGSAGQAPLIGWSPYPDKAFSPVRGQLWMGDPDGSFQQAIYETVMQPQASYLVFRRWSTDGRSVYFSQEPWGLGGYSLEEGASSLFKYSLDTQQLEIIRPFDPAQGTLCLDDLSPDETRTADHCNNSGIQIEQRSEAQLSHIDPPTNGNNLGALGARLMQYSRIFSARFSPDNQRVAYALALGNPLDEQGWVAVSSNLSGGSQAVWATEPGHYATVLGWLNDSVLLVQVTADLTPTAVWVVYADGTRSYKVADGAFVALLPE